MSTKWNDIKRPSLELLSAYINSLAPWRPRCHFKTAIFNLVLLIGIFTSSNEKALWWMPNDLTDYKSTLVQVMAWCRQATSHYLSQCWPSSMSPYSVTSPQWVNNKPTVVHVTAPCRTGDTPLPEPMTIQLTNAYKRHQASACQTFVSHWISLLQAHQRLWFTTEKLHAWQNLSGPQFVISVKEYQELQFVKRLI